MPRRNRRRRRPRHLDQPEAVATPTTTPDQAARRLVSAGICSPAILGPTPWRPTDTTTTEKRNY